MEKWQNNGKRKLYFLLSLPYDSTGLKRYLERQWYLLVGEIVKPLVLCKSCVWCKWNGKIKFRITEHSASHHLMDENMKCFKGKLKHSPKYSISLQVSFLILPLVLFCFLLWTAINVIHNEEQQCKRLCYWESKTT